MSESPSTINPLQQIEEIYQHFERNYTETREPVDQIDDLPSTDSIDPEKIKAINEQVNTILKDNYGLYIAAHYGFFKYCGQNSIYPLSYAIEIDMFKDHAENGTGLFELVEKYKELIESTTNSNVYDFIYNKIKFLHHYGFTELTVLKPNDIVNMMTLAITKPPVEQPLDAVDLAISELLKSKVDLSTYSAADTMPELTPD